MSLKADSRIKEFNDLKEVFDYITKEVINLSFKPFYFNIPQHLPDGIYHATPLDKDGVLIDIPVDIEIRMNTGYVHKKKPMIG